MLFYEAAAAALAAISLVHFAKAGRRRALIVFCLALASVGIGEALNHMSSTTLYHSDFSMIPGTRLPLFIVPGGACISAWVFHLSVLLEKRLKVRLSRLAAALLLSLTLPFASELFGVRLGLWRWNIPFQFTFVFLAGIWKFYMIFLFSPAFLMLLVPEKSVHFRQLQKKQDDVS